MRFAYILFVIFLLALFSGCGVNGEAKTVDSLDQIQKEQLQKEKIITINRANEVFAEAVAGEENEDGVTVVGEPDSEQVIVNKDRKLPDGYEPPDLMIPDVTFKAVNEERKHLRKPAALALEKLFEAAEDEGIELVAVSGYRRYETQVYLYNRNVEVKGKEYADQYSAKPGHSEHQTGLAMDVSAASVAFDLVEAFEETPEGQWVAENAHEFGFVIRYPKGKSDITGYNFEPWHLRYVGPEIATSIHEQNVTIEKFFGLVE
ncbi:MULTISPECIES: D-alanyl-D-alanine carboxypeptidase family protein [Allobacillus]|uniref:M15 family metallopeptidase n=1 Tax=Allobacillus salarius TaxID=1955272 RepID=A0A556PNR4_9BACI|nr:M15 family metallopeptidase [Allobacillus salarius]TSJ66008.1 M15 family metallopeptidase [Allobacillus salarius]